MSFKTEYHVDVSFLHDLVTMGHTAKVRSTKAPSADSPSADAPNADEKSTNTQKIKWAKSKKLSIETKDTRKAAKDRWIADRKELAKYKQYEPLDEHMKQELFEAATRCDLSSPVDRFKNMWKNLTYRNKTIIQGYWNNKRASLNQDIKNPQISLSLLNFINEDVFNTLLQCIVTDFNNEKFDPVYLTKLTNFAMGRTPQECYAMTQIWENLNFRAQDRVIIYFQMRPDLHHQLKFCMDLKKKEENRKKIEYEKNRTPQSRSWNSQDNVDENGWERL